jgi:hypothetical protein
MFREFAFLIVELCLFFREEFFEFRLFTKSLAGFMFSGFMFTTLLKFSRMISASFFLGDFERFIRIPEEDFLVGFIAIFFLNVFGEFNGFCVYGKFQFGA